MRAFSRFAALALMLLAALVAAGPPLQISVHEVAKDVYRVDAKNISGRGLVAHVIVLKSPDGTSTRVAHGLYTEGDMLPAGGIVRLDQFQSRAVPIVTVDYVRLVDGWSWGAQATDIAKEFAARFRRTN